jgi:hypothetical protein
MWIHVIPHFNQFLKDLELSVEDRADADGKAERVARSLFATYYPNQQFTHTCYVKVGSYGKGIASNPRSDLDMLFILPNHVYWRFDALQNNKQSQLLQEAKRNLLGTFHSTDLRADGQVVMAPFGSYHIDVVPSFKRDDGTYIIAHTGDGGSWVKSDPVTEYRQIQYVDSITVGKSTHLNKMVKAWKRECNVDIKSISLEVLVNKFLYNWYWRNQTVFFYDWMVRDFFQFLLPYVNGKTCVPGTEEWIELGDCWGTKAQSAYDRAVKACDYEQADRGDLATLEWRKIFGDEFKGTSMLLGALLRA